MIDQGNACYSRIKGSEPYFRQKIRGTAKVVDIPKNALL